MLLWRVLSSLVLIPVVLLLLYYSSVIWFQLTVVIVELIIAFELIKISDFNKKYKIDKEVIISSILFIAGSLLLSFRLALEGALTITIIMILVWEMTKERDMAVVFESFAINSFSVIYVSWFLNHAVLLRRVDVNLVLLVLLITWANDIGAYSIGKLFGRHKLAENISPAKTYEGSIAGLCSGIITAELLKYYLFKSISYSDMFIGALFISIAGQFGDLVESAIKRSFKVKDSGNLIPGHGGLLDRVDSLIFAFPIAFYYFVFLSHLR
ncbi:MAG: CDP-archaeol synthase [Candidatus Firestonebacteria bacterium]|nr:CDP-archaeol synthase [Candidatus Firestonebacteria bacterium]